MNKLQKNIIKSYRYILSTHRWSLMYKTIKDDNYTDIKQSQSLARADSFVVEYEDKTYLFFEEFVIEKNRKGYLSVGELSINSNEIINIQKVLEKDHHLSYPFIFKHKKQWYMIPETHSNFTIDLYKFTSFPYKIEKVKTLIGDIDAVDTTITIKDDIVYLFTNVKKKGEIHNENLSLFYSDGLLNGEFIEHRQSPLNTDIRYARMAGSVLEDDNKLYRIAQDCSINYGSCIYKFEVLELSKTNYKEKLVKTIYPPKGCNASHTFSKSENYEVIDVMKNNISFRNIIQNIINLFISILRKVFK